MSARQANFRKERFRSAEQLLFITKQNKIRARTDTKEMYFQKVGIAAQKVTIE